MYEKFGGPIVCLCLSLSPFPPSFSSSLPTLSEKNPNLPGKVSAHNRTKRDVSLFTAAQEVTSYQSLEQGPESSSSKNSFSK